MLTCIICWKVSKTQYDRVHGYIEAGKKEGAKVILGGEKRSGKGFFIDPTSELPKRVDINGYSCVPRVVFTDIRPDMKIVSPFTVIYREAFIHVLTHA